MRLLAATAALTFLLAVPEYASAQMMMRDTVHSEPSGERQRSTHRWRLRTDNPRRFMGQLYMTPLYLMAYMSVSRGTEALAGVSFGWDVDGFEPYPHRVSRTVDTDGDGEGDWEPDPTFRWGYVGFGANDDASRAQIAVVNLTPFLTDISLFVLSDLLLQYAVDPRGEAAPFLLFGGMVTPLVNFIAGISCMDDGCDLVDFAEAGNIPHSVAVMFGYLMAATAIWRVVHQFQRVFMERVPREPRRRAVAVSPFAGEGSAGLAVAATF
ncbi:hypothetical protein ACFL26_00295 [Patescibacteria group bacterium]